MTFKVIQGRWFWHQFKAHKGLDCAGFYVPANTV